MNNNVIDANQYGVSDDEFLRELFNPTPARPESNVNLPELQYKFTEEERMAAPDEEDVLPYLGDPNEDHTPVIVEDTRPAEERIDELFERMKTRRKVLMGIINRCREASPVEEIHAFGDQLQAFYRSVFDGPAMCNLLVRAGAIERLEDETQEPKTVVIDGVEYLEPACEKKVVYKATEAGLAVVEADKPMERLNEVFEQDEMYKPIYLQILTACAEEGGKSAKELGALVDGDPLLQNPRFWAAHFFNKLGECDALVWDGTWKTTELGAAVANELAAELGC